MPPKSAMSRVKSYNVSLDALKFSERVVTYPRFKHQVIYKELGAGNNLQCLFITSRDCMRSAMLLVLALNTKCAQERERN